MKGNRVLTEMLTERVKAPRHDAEPARFVTSPLLQATEELLTAEIAHALSEPWIDAVGTTKLALARVLSETAPGHHQAVIAAFHGLAVALVGAAR